MRIFCDVSSVADFNDLIFSRNLITSYTYTHAHTCVRVCVSGVEGMGRMAFE